MFFLYSHYFAIFFKMNKTGVIYILIQCCGALRGGAPRGAPGRCEANFRPSRGVGAGRSHFAPRAGALGRGEAILRPGWGVGAGRSYFAPRAGALGRGAYVFWALWCAPRPGALAAPRGACTAPVITNMKFENIFLLIFLYKKRSKKLEL